MIAYNVICNISSFEDKKIIFSCTYDPDIFSLNTQILGIIGLLSTFIMCRMSQNEKWLLSATRVLWVIIVEIESDNSSLIVTNCVISDSTL